MNLREIAYLSIIAFALIFSGCRGDGGTDFEVLNLTLLLEDTSIEQDGQTVLHVEARDINGILIEEPRVVTFTTSDLITISPNPLTLTGGKGDVVIQATGRAGEAIILANADQVTAEEVLIVRSTAAHEILLTASPNVVPAEGGIVSLTALIRDSAGRPLPDIEVHFAADIGELDSNGRGIRTNAQGLAGDRLEVEAQGSSVLFINVTATTPRGVPTSISIRVEGSSTGTPPKCSFEIFPEEEITVGETVFFTDTSTDDDGSIQQTIFDFGDGISATGFVTDHRYNEAGSYTVNHTVIDDQRNSSTCSGQVQVTNR